MNTQSLGKAKQWSRYVTASGLSPVSALFHRASFIFPFYYELPPTNKNHGPSQLLEFLSFQPLSRLHPNFLLVPSPKILSQMTITSGQEVGIR